MMVLGSFQVDNTASSSVRGTDSIVGYDAYNAYTATTSAATLNAPASGYGNLYYSSDQYDQYKVAVVAGDEVTFQFSRSATTSYIDLYFYNNAKTRVNLASNVKTYTYTVTATGTGYAYLAVDADSSADTGNYYLSVTKAGSGGGGVEDGGSLTDGVAASGHMDSADGSDMWYIDVDANAESMYVALTCGSADFDTYGRFGAEPTTSTYDWRGYTSGGEENTVSSPAQGRHYIMVDYYSGDADYSLTATVTYGVPADTTAPSVSISSPSNGATVSDTVTISFSSSDANGISSRAIKIDGSTVSASSSYSWDTTGYSDGSHTIQCTATDPSGNTGSDTHTVTVDNAPVVTGDMGTGVDGYDSYSYHASATMLSTPISGTGTIDLSSDQYDLFGVAVSSGDEVTITFSAPSGATGLDVPIYDVTGSAFMTKSNVGTFTETVTASGAGTVQLAIDADATADSGTYSLQITVSSGGGGGGTDDGGALTDGAAASGHMSESDGADMFYIDVGPDATSMQVVLSQSAGDFDTYGRFGAEPTTSTYDWRGYTSGGEDNTVSSPSEGRHYIMVDWYSGDADYTLTATITYGGGGGGTGSWGTGGKYAIIVGISDYQSISDLSYCDEDASDIYNFLNGQGYECHVYGDGHTSNYPRYDGDAYESTVRTAVQELANHAQSGDTVIFTTSGHGSGDGNGNSYLCMYDCSGSSGCYYDYELQSDFSGFASGVNIMVFVDHCYSGGLGPELQASHGSIYITTTCTEDGYGYDEPTHQNGAWTYEFFEKYWVGNPSWSAEYVYDQASASYPHTGGDACMEFDGFSGSFYI
jgi:hypothetical protein